MTTIQDKALIVSLKISMWTARKFDRKITKEVEDSHNATGAGRFNKCLIAEDELKKVSKVANAIRTFHYENTLAWSDDGSRLLPSANFLTYTQELAVLTSQFDQVVKTFIMEYPSMIEEARYRLNGMFNAAEYPTDIASKFEAKAKFFPVPDAEDFRVSLSADEIAGLKNDLQVEINSRVAAATTDIWDRIKSALSSMVSRLGDKDAIFRDSLVNNIQDLIGLLPKLNLSNDPAINNTVKEMERLLVSPEALRTNTLLRQKTADEAQAILSKMQGYF